MRKYIDKVMHRLGYVRWDRTIQGEIEFKSHEQPFVNLTILGGNASTAGWTTDYPCRP